MYVATLWIEVRIVAGFRGKRRTVRAIVEKLHRHFNVSVAEVDRSGHASTSILGIAAVAPSRREARDILDRVAEAVAAHPRALILDLKRADL